MVNKFKQVVEEFLSLPDVSSQTADEVRRFINSTGPYIKSGGNPTHLNVFFLPYNEHQKMIYLGHHKKANDWIPPGGHIEKNESPLDAAVREFREELRVTKNPSSFHPLNVSVKHIERHSSMCKTHYDLWFLVDSEVEEFDYDEREYYDADWFSFEEGISKITKNPEFVSIIKKLRSN